MSMVVVLVMKINVDYEDRDVYDNNNDGYEDSDNGGYDCEVGDDVGGFADSGRYGL